MTTLWEFESLLEVEDTLLYAQDARARGRRGRPSRDSVTTRFLALSDSAIPSDVFATHVRLSLLHANQLHEEAHMVSAAKKLGENVRTRAHVKEMVKTAVKHQKEWVNDPTSPRKAAPATDSAPESKGALHAQQQAVAVQRQKAAKSGRRSLASRNPALVFGAGQGGAMVGSNAWLNALRESFHLRRKKVESKEQKARQPPSDVAEAGEMGNAASAQDSSDCNVEQEGVKGHEEEQPSAAAEQEPRAPILFVEPDRAASPNRLAPYARPRPCTPPCRSPSQDPSSPYSPHLDISPSSHDAWSLPSQQATPSTTDAVVDNCSSDNPCNLELPHHSAFSNLMTTGQLFQPPVASPTLAQLPQPRLSDSGPALHEQHTEAVTGCPLLTDAPDTCTAELDGDTTASVDVAWDGATSTFTTTPPAFALHPGSPTLTHLPCPALSPQSPRSPRQPHFRPPHPPFSPLASCPSNSSPRSSAEFAEAPGLNTTERADADAACNTAEAALHVGSSPADAVSFSSGQGSGVSDASPCLQPIQGLSSGGKALHFMCSPSSHSPTSLSGGKLQLKASQHLMQLPALLLGQGMAAGQAGAPDAARPEGPQRASISDMAEPSYWGHVQTMGEPASRQQQLQPIAKSAQALCLHAPPLPSAQPLTGLGSALSVSGVGSGPAPTALDPLPVGALLKGRVSAPAGAHKALPSVEAQAKVAAIVVAARAPAYPVQPSDASLELHMRASKLPLLQRDTEAGPPARSLRQSVSLNSRVPGQSGANASSGQQQAGGLVAAVPQIRIPAEGVNGFPERGRPATGCWPHSLERLTQAPPLHNPRKR